MLTPGCRRLFWLVLGFTFGMTWIQTVRYATSLSATTPDKPRTDRSSGPVKLPPFEGKIYKLDGPWEVITVKNKADSAAETDLLNLNLLGQTPTGAEEKRWLDLQRQRREAVRQYCDSHKALRVSPRDLRKSEISQFYKTVLLGAKHRVLYCPVGKVACTSWKTVIATLQGHYSGLQPGEHIHDLEVLTRNDVKPLRLVENPDSILETYPIFLFVRHPFERLASAFKNKFHAPNKENLQMKYGREIIRRYRGSAAPEEELRTGWGVRFPELIKWILDDNVKNIHWDSFNDICHLCSVPYTFVGKMYTFTEDSKYILKYLFGTENFQKFPHSNPSPRSSRNPLEELFRNVTVEDIGRLKDRYDIDFKMFNYTWPIS